MTFIEYDYHMSAPAVLSFMEDVSETAMEMWYEGEDDKYAAYLEYSGFMGQILAEIRGEEYTPPSENPYGSEDAVPQAHHIYEKLLDNMGDAPSLEEIWIVCWHPMRFIKENLSEQETDALGAGFKRLSNIVKRLKAQHEPDGYILDKDAAVFIHISAGLVLLSEILEGAQTEWQEERIDDAIRVMRMPQTESITPFYEETKYPRTLEASTSLAEALLWARLAVRRFRSSEYMEALRDSRQMFERLDKMNANLFKWVWHGSLPDEYAKDEFMNDSSSIAKDFLVDHVHTDENVPEREDAKAHRLFRTIFAPQIAVDAFDALIEEDSRNTDWEQVARLCRYFGSVWPITRCGIKSKHIDSSSADVGDEAPLGMESRRFWQPAYGIALNKMSDDDRIKEVRWSLDELRRNKDGQIEDRLRLYFFPEHWDILPEKARASLISADSEYERKHGRRPIIFDHLRHAARAMMVETFWQPYQEFLRAKAKAGLKDLSDLPKVQKALEDNLAEPDLAKLVNSPYFEEFLSTIKEDTKFVKRLPKKLMDLNEWANTVSHKHHWGYKGFEGQLRETYAEFLGIGHNGILPRLARLHPKIAAGRR